MPELLRLGGNRFDQVRMAMTERGDGDAAGEVEEFAAVGGIEIATLAPFDGDVPPAIGRHDSWNHGKLSCAMNGGNKVCDGASLIVVAVPPAARFRAPLPKAGSSCRDCASSPLSSPQQAGHADPGGIEQESKRLWGSPGDLSIRRSG